jgi:uncharacterized protein (TIGR02588 family)
MKRPHKNGLEWSVFFLSAALVLAILGYLVFAAVQNRDSPPDLQITTGTPRSHRVPVTVRNEGDSTAESVRIEVLLMRGSEEVERAELDLPFVPHRSKREGWVEFRHDPRCCAVVTRAVGFTSP